MTVKVFLRRFLTRLTNAVALFLLFAFYFSLPSCTNRQSSDNIFHYNEQTGIASLDPAFAKNQSIMWAIHQLYNTLVEVDKDLRIVPSLAKRWEVSDDRLTYTFYLRNDVYFHDDAVFAGGKGRKMTAYDVEYSLKRIPDSKTASPGAWIFNRKVDSANAFKTIDDTTFQLKLAKPYNPILGILSMQYCSVTAKEAVEKYGTEFRKHPVGTGPFSFVVWEEGQALILKKNSRYFEKDSADNRLPYLDGIKISFNTSKATEFLLFRQKQLEFINDIEPSFKDDVLTKKGTLKKNWEGKIVLNTHPYLNIEYLGILVDSTNENVKNSPARLKKIRQAINYGFDRNKLILYLRNSLGNAANSGFVPQGLPSFDTTLVKGYRYDPVKTKQLLKEAGFADGKGLLPITLLTVSIYSDIANYIAKQLEESGIPIKVEVVQKSLLLQLTSNSKALFFRGSWIADYPDAENYLSCFYSKNPAPPNYTRYKSAAFDALFEKAMLSDNDSVRYDLYRQADRVITDDAPFVPIWYDEVIHLVQPYVSGFQPNALNLLELRHAKIIK
jgi:ABC-type transport system substrate-binding protein